VADWARDVLAALRAPVTTGNLRLLKAWQRAEGGHTHNTATWNWLNTTRGKQFPSMNSVGVRRFPDYKTGVAYTADTIIGGYPGIVSALRAGKPYTPKFRPQIVADFSKWVSGQRTGREDYGYKILGMKGPFPKVTPLRLATAQPKNRNELDLGALASALDDGDDFWDMVAANPIDLPEMAAPKSPAHPMAFAPSKGKTLIPRIGKGTHVTDNLDWNNGRKTASDIMAAAGTPVGAPEAGKIIRHGSAQGGRSIYFQGNSGRMYWLGHIDNRLPVGTKVRRGQRIALVSADHETPHLHFDYKL
jgi:hypothetical protein